MSRRCIVAVAALVAIGLTGCGSGGPATEVSSGAGRQQASGTGLPTLPGAQQRHPELYDEAGCARTSEGSDCATRAADLDAELAGTSEGDWRVLAGFSGSRWTTELAGGVAVLTETVTTGTAPDGVWVGRGLVRNNGSTEIAGVEVHATLLDGSGTVLGTATEAVRVPSIRPGEPIAFEVSADDVVIAAPAPTTTAPTTTAPTTTAQPPTTAPTPAPPTSIVSPQSQGASAQPTATTTSTSSTSSTSTTSTTSTTTTTVLPSPQEVLAVHVAEVRWTVTTSGPPTESTPRDLELGVLWQRGLADPRPVDMYLFHDPPGGPLPLVVFGGATAVGPAPVADVSVLGAWVDATGRVVEVADAVVARPEGVNPDGPLPVPSLEPGEIADLVLTVDAAAAPVGLDDARLMLWGWGS